MEQLLKTHPFSIAGAQYEIRVVENGTEIKARVFYEGKPAYQFSSLGVTREVPSDSAAHLHVEAIASIVAEIEKLARKYAGLMQNDRF